MSKSQDSRLPDRQNNDEISRARSPSDDLHRLLADAIQDMSATQLLEFVTHSLPTPTIERLFSDDESARARIVKYRGATIETLESLRTTLLIALHKTAEA